MCLFNFNQPYQRSLILNSSNPFKWRHFQPEIIVLCLCWYLRYSLSFRNLEEMMLERGLRVAHSTICRWVQGYSKELDQRCRPYLKPTNDSWRVDETYLKGKGKWCYLYRAVDSTGQTLDFMLSEIRDAVAAKRFLLKTLDANHTQSPRVINVDKNPAYPKAVAELKEAGLLGKDCELRQVKYLNNMVEQDHRAIKRLVKIGQNFENSETGWEVLRGYEAMNMIRKGQITGVKKGEIKEQVRFVNGLFGIAA